MSRASTIAENSALTGLAGAATFFGVASTDPTTTGANEISGGTYARVALAFSTASGGSIANSGALTINVPASTTVAYFNSWNTATVSGTTGYEVGGALSSSQTFNTAGTLSFAIGAVTISLS